MDHEQFYELVMEGEDSLTDVQKKELDEHAATCESCRRTRNGVRGARRILTNPEAALGPSPAVKERVLARLREEPPTPPPAPAAPRLLGALATLLIAALAFGAGLLVASSRQAAHEPPPPPPVTPPAPPVAPPPAPPAPLPAVPDEHLMGGNLDWEAAKLLSKYGYREQAKVFAQKALDSGDLNEAEKKKARQILAR